MIPSRSQSALTSCRSTNGSNMSSRCLIVQGIKSESTLWKISSCRGVLHVSFHHLGDLSQDQSFDFVRFVLRKKMIKRRLAHMWLHSTLHPTPTTVQDYCTTSKPIWKSLRQPLNPRPESSYSLCTKKRRSDSKARSEGLDTTSALYMVTCPRMPDLRLWIISRLEKSMCLLRPMSLLEGWIFQMLDWCSMSLSLWPLVGGSFLLFCFSFFLLPKAFLAGPIGCLLAGQSQSQSQSQPIPISRPGEIYRSKLPQMTWIIHITRTGWTDWLIFTCIIEDFVHRCGRTGRAGKSGKAVTFFTGENHERSLAGEFMRVLRDVGADVSFFSLTCGLVWLGLVWFGSGKPFWFLFLH